MRTSTVIMIAVAAVFGLLAVFATRSWLHSQQQARVQPIVTTTTVPIATRTVVVAARPLRFGNELTAQVLREAPWPEEAPQGSFARIDEMLAGGKRVVLTAIEANEPVLPAKITGPGQRATLSALVGPGMKAVTIRVNDVDGVGGFVLPGDHVDVVLTRRHSGQAGESDRPAEGETTSSQVLLQDVRVLAVDQMADERTANPTIPKAVTLEVETAAGQKLSLAASIGTLSLLLRKAGEVSDTRTSRISIKDLMNDLLGGPKPTSTVRTVVVTRGSKKEDYRVPQETDAYANATAEAK